MPMECTKKSLGPFILACILVGLLIWAFISGRMRFVSGLTVETIVPEPLGPEFYSEMRNIKINFIFIVLIPIIPIIISIYYLILGKFFDDGDALNDRQRNIVDYIVSFTIIILLLLEVVAFQIAWDKGIAP